MARKEISEEAQRPNRLNLVIASNHIKKIMRENLQQE